MRAALSITFDEALPSQVDVRTRVLDAHGIAATFFVDPGSLEARVDRWADTLEAGHEIGNHAVSHPCGGHHPLSRVNAPEDDTLERIGSELGACDEALQRLLGVVPTSFALAAAAHVTPEHLCRVWTANLGCGPITSLRLLRLARAGDLLRRSNTSVSAVADEVGIPRTGARKRSGVVTCRRASPTTGIALHAARLTAHR